ncbi:hypothetical protein D9M71_302680 [compost metagenome]
MRGFVEVFGETQHAVVAAFEQGRQCRAPLLQRNPAQVHAVEVHQVEQVIENVAIAAQVKGILQGLEVRHPRFVGHDHLAVEPRRVYCKFAQGLGLARQSGRPVVTIAGEQPHRAIVDAGHQAIAIEFDLVAPVAGG